MKPKHKPYKQQEDRLLKRFSRLEQRKQMLMRLKIKEDLRL